MMQRNVAGYVHKSTKVFDVLQAMGATPVAVRASRISIDFQLKTIAERLWRLVILTAIAWCFSTSIAHSEPVVYSGELVVTATSGGGCSDESLGQTKKIELGFDRDSDGQIRGWFHGEVMNGTFLGDDLSELKVSYPFYQQELAEGHRLSVKIERDRLYGELSESHLDESVPQCNYDQARLALARSDQNASEWLSKAEALFTANQLRFASRHWIRKGDWPQAIGLGEQALELLENAQIEDLILVDILSDLALYYEKSGNAEVAESMYRQALNVAERVMGAEHRYTATCLNNLGLYYRQQGNYAAAESLYRRALTISEKGQGKENPGTAVYLSNLALLCRVQGREEEADELQKRALQIKLKEMGVEGEIIGIEHKKEPRS